VVLIRLKIGQKEDRKVKNDRRKGIECIYGCKKLRREQTVSFLLLHSDSFSVLERTKQCTKHRYSKKIFYEPQATFQRFEMLGNLELGIGTPEEHSSVQCTVRW
jgi:hypothetical protein